MTNINDSELFSLASIGMLILSSEGIVIDANPECCKLLESNTKINGKHIQELFKDELPLNLKEWYSIESTSHKETISYTVRLNTFEKTNRWGAVTFTLINHGPLRKNILCQIQNISEQKETGDQLDQQSHLLEELIDHIPDSIFIKDTDSRFILANEAVSKLMGVSDPKELIGRTDFDFHPRKLATKYRNDEISVIKSGEAQLNIVEQVIDPKHNVRWYSTSKLPLRDHEGRIIGIMGIGREITQWIKKQKALRKAKHAAEKADQLKTAFLANLSHEVRTPLNGILGFSQFLRQMIEPGSKGSKYIDYIVQNGKSLLHLISDIIDISKIETGQLLINKKNFLLNELMHQLELSIREVLVIKDKEHIMLTLELDLDDNDCILFSDDLRIKQILHNLLLNAVKFTEKGSITFGYRVERKAITFFVKDTGIGIAPEHLDLIFELFTQVDHTLARQYEGTGIGLPIVKGLVHLLKGQLTVKSELSHGSEFSFTLPIAVKQKGKPAEKEEEPVTSIPLVYMVGNYPSIGEIFEASQLVHSVTLRQFSNFSDFLTHLKQKQQFPDLVLCYPDRSLSDSPKLINELSELMPEVPILVIINSNRILVTEMCLAAGAKDYISDPVNPILLAEKVKILIGDRINP
jgi:PAS domain S-box-containing protein